MRRVQVFWFSGVRRNRQRCCTTEQAGGKMKEAAERLSKPWANTFPHPLWQCGIAARTRSEDLMPADVIWTDAGPGTGYRQPLCSWEQTGGRQHQQERSHPHRSGPSPLARSLASATFLDSCSTSCPRLPAPAPHRLWGACCLPLKHPSQTTLLFSRRAVRHVVRHNSPLSPPDDSPFHQPVVFHHR